MQRHWSARRHSKPHGRSGVWTAILQVAPIWEMLDKALFLHRPRDREYGPLDGRRQPLLQRESSQTRSGVHTPRSDLPKGSPGENAMRGVRKMSMVNLPQAMLSLWVHAGALVPVDGEPQTQSQLQLGLAFMAAFLCVAFGIADYVLYIWVLDAFVRENKKLVTLYYCVEILSRVPIVVLFHVSYSRGHSYMPTVLLFSVDVLLTSLLLTKSRVSRPSGWWATCICCFPDGVCTRRGLMQFLYSLVISVQLFFVNMVYFDPGMIFFYVNKAFYIIKYAELFIMMMLIRDCRNCTDGLVLAPHPKNAFKFFFGGEIMLALINSFFVYYYVPKRRQAKDARLTSSAGPASGSASSDEGLEPVNAGSPESQANSEPGRMLLHLEEVFELLLLLSKTGCSQNRDSLLSVTVGELWSQVLGWHGEYDDGQGGIVQITPKDSRCAWVRRRRAGSAKPDPPRVAMLNGPRILEADRCGLFNSVRVRWDNGEVWTRRDDPQGQLREQAREVMHLILPQLALALKWDTTSVSDAPEEGGPEMQQEAGRAAESLDLEMGAGRATRAWPGGISPGPLLRFLIQYGLVTRQAHFISELYWALFCFSHDSRRTPAGGREQRQGQSQLSATSSGHHVNPGHHPDPYSTARLALLRDLCSSTDGQAQPQAGADVEEGELEQFRRSVRRQLRAQRELWRQKMGLLDHLGHRGAPGGGSGGSGTGGTHASAAPSSAGSGAWCQRTEELREALRRWPHVKMQMRLKPLRVSTALDDEDEELLQSPRDADADGRFLESPRSGAEALDSLDTPRPAARYEQARHSVDLVSPESANFVSLPIDPAVPFFGVVVEESEVMPSKWAPVLFSCKTSEADLHDQRVKYLLKNGDDLRQDQLMLQLMSLMGCVWQERLEQADAQCLQVTKYRVLAMTPQCGYVKFVPDAIPLSQALHQSQGNLVDWLERNKKPDTKLDKVLDTFCGSVAASCVVTYILGIGDRHLENLCLTTQGQFFHIDFSFVLGDDPKPCAPQVRLPQQVAQALHRTGRWDSCLRLAAQAYKELRPFAGLWGSVLQLTAAAGGAGCQKLANEPLAAVAGVRERLRVDQHSGDDAASEFLCLVRESSEGLSSILMDKVHAAGLFWR